MSVIVFSCDYGEIIVSDAEKLRLLPDKFKRLPQLAIRGKLHGNCTNCSRRQCLNHINAISFTQFQVYNQRIKIGIQMIVHGFRSLLSAKVLQVKLKQLIMRQMIKNLYWI